MTVIVASLLVALLVSEIVIRVSRQGRPGISSAPAPKALSFESHPYALYVKRPNSDGLYPSNSLGYAGKREVSRTKAPNAIRIYCVGGSTMEAHDPRQGPDSSWPAKLQDILGARFPGVSIECTNAGTAGYTSAESLAEFVFRGLDLKPDILLVYHNVNDVWTCQMVDGFESDYSHARRHKPWRLGWVNKIPQLRALHTYELIRRWIVNRYGKANALIYWIADPPWDAVGTVHPNALYAFRRNITNLVAVAQTWACVPVLIRWECDWSAAYHPPYFRRRTAESASVYRDYLLANNRALRDVGAQCRDCHYIEVGPFEPDHFLDTMHFSPSGLDEMARRVADGIGEIVKSVVEARNLGDG